MSDPAWDAYLKIMPTAAVVAVDRHGSVNLYDGPIFFSPTASRWCPINDSVKKVPVGLMPTTGDFSPEQAVKINPAIDPELQKRIQATIRGGPTADPVPSQWTGTIDNSAEMVKMQEVVKATVVPETIGFMEPAYQTTTPPLFTQTMGVPSVVDRKDTIKVETGVVSAGPAPLVVSSSQVVKPTQNAHVASLLREQATKLLTLADTLERS